MGLCRMLMSCESWSVSGIVDGLEWRVIKMSFEGGPQIWSLPLCVMQTWKIALWSRSHNGFEFVSMSPRRG
jgi:hypothetical protein